MLVDETYIPVNSHEGSRGFESVTNNVFSQTHDKILQALISCGTHHGKGHHSHNIYYVAEADYFVDRNKMMWHSLELLYVSCVYHTVCW